MISRLSEICTIKYGKDHKNLSEGNIPVYGSGGVMRYANKAIYKNKSVLIPRKGTLGNLFFVSEPFWTVDTLFYTEIDEIKAVPEYLYYYLKTLDLAGMNVGTAVPSLTTAVLNEVEIDLPTLSEQQAIASILSALDARIANNTKINHHLEQIAQAIFKSWFVDFEPFGGEQPAEWQNGKLGQYVNIKRGGSPRPIQDFLADSGLRWLKISDVTSLHTPYVLTIKEHIKESGLKKTVFLQSGALVLSNSATPGIPKILGVDTCIHDGWLYFPSSLFSNEYLYLFFMHIRQDLVALGNGSVFTNLKTDILKNYAVIVPDNHTRIQFDEFVVPLFRKMEACTRESLKLTEMRDSLLPRLMSGELTIADISDFK